MHVLLIGGSGSLMDNLIIRLNKEGHRVFRLSKNKEEKRSFKQVFENYYFDYEDRKSVV